MFICPGCGRRTAGDRHLGHQPRGGESCGFGFLFELLDDYYPSPKTALIVCDQSRKILALGHAATAVTGFREGDLLGHEVVERLGIVFTDGTDQVAHCLEWGVRGKGLDGTFRPSGLAEHRAATFDLFPAYDDDGGIMVALTPR